MTDDEFQGVVAARLAAQTPSNTRPAHCWFCGKIEAWFQCNCPEARDAQQGRRAKPRYDAKLDAMILDEEIIRRNLDWGVARRYVAAKPAVTPVTPAPAESVTRPMESVTERQEGDAAVTPVSPTAERMRRYRQRRAEQRGKQEP